MHEITEVVDRYFAFWNEPDAARRRELARGVFADDLRYVGPEITASDRDGIEAVAEQVVAEMPGLALRPLGAVESHHDRLRYRWEIVMPNGTTRFAAGTDVAEVAADGRIRVITVFLDEPPVRMEAPHHQAE